MQEKRDRQPKLKERLMYGSDWSMIGQEEQHARYYDDVRDALSKLDLMDDERSAIRGANALRYLGLTRRSKQYHRLEGFFEDAPQFTSVMSIIRPSFVFAFFGESLYWTCRAFVPPQELV
ncbi:MAG: hypothetical protein ACI84R_003611 [Candidatus Azotimanducaceae bacterium]|jgi:hypothetical protein